jgi:DNA-binding LytR/AlgR family response regulator
MPLRCIIIDDETLAAEILEHFVAKDVRLTFVRSYTSAGEALAALDTDAPDLIFLDIEMPAINGVEFLRSLCAPPLTIFTTARRDYALEGFELNAVDYLVKPFTLERFLQAVGKAVELWKARHSTLPVSASSTANRATESRPAQDSQHLWVRADGRLVKVPLEEILYIEAQQDYVSINTRSGALLALQSLTTVEEALQAGFCRVHRSYIVALAHIRFIEGNLIHIGSVTIPIGRNYRDTLFAQISQDKHL